MRAQHQDLSFEGCPQMGTERQGSTHSLDLRQRSSNSELEGENVIPEPSGYQEVGLVEFDRGRFRSHLEGEGT